MEISTEYSAYGRREPLHPHSVPTLAEEGIATADPLSEIEPGLRYRMISEAAYHRYLARGCEDGYDLDDWLAAETEVDRQLRQAAGTGEA